MFPALTIALAPPPSSLAPRPTLLCDIGLVLFRLFLK
jgi:hypothetical protein